VKCVKEYFTTYIYILCNIALRKCLFILRMSVWGSRANSGGSYVIARKAPLERKTTRIARVSAARCGAMRSTKGKERAR